MSFKSIFQDMKEEIGSLSRRGFRSRSHRVVQDNSVVPVDALRQSCWANMPPELLRDVLMRIEDSEISWPLRMHVVACAGVCRSWREIMKEIVKIPQISSKLTFPISLKQPGPRSSLIQCYIKRNRSSQTYHLFLGKDSVSYDDGKFLLAARKCRHPTCTYYIISLNPDCFSRGSSAYIGKLRSNFLGTKFTIYDSQPASAGPRIVKSRSTRLAGFKQAPKVPASNYPIARLSYELNVLGSRGPRRVQCMMETIPASSIEAGGEAPTPTEFLTSSLESFPSIPFSRSKSTRLDNFTSGTCEDGKLILRNKTPRWHEQLQCWCLNFNGRVTVASVKNFQLVALLENGSEHENVVLQFGKVGKDVFTMDHTHTQQKPTTSKRVSSYPPQSMAYYNNRQGYCEDDRMNYTEQSCGSRPANYMRPQPNNHMQMTQCDSYTTGQGGAGYGQGGYYAPTPAYNSGACFERKDEFCVSNSNSRCHRFRPSGHRSRRVMRYTESRGSYSSSESDSD